MFFTNTPGRLLLYIKFFFSSRSTRVPEIIRTFQEKFIFQMIRPFFCCSCLDFKRWKQGILISLARGWNSNYIDKIFKQAWTLKKLETFYTLFRIFLRYFTKEKEIWKTIRFRCFVVLVKINLKVLNVVLLIKIENTYHVSIISDRFLQRCRKYPI